MMSSLERLRDFLWEDIKQQHLGTLLKEVPLIDEVIEEREGNYDDPADVEHEKPSHECFGQADGDQKWLQDRAHDQKPDEAKDSSRSAASGHNAAHMMTTLEVLNPPRLIISSHGRTKNVRSWTKR